MNYKFRSILGVSASIAALQLGVLSNAAAAAGTEAASFLLIPTGSGPSAMAGAYTALANDAYATTWNPAGLGALTSNEFAGQHLAYLESIHYEHLGIAARLPGARGGVGASIQYLGTGDIDSTDTSGEKSGEFSSYYSAYSIAYGRSLNDSLSLGGTVKAIQAKLEDHGASAFASDFGVLWRQSERLRLAATLNNLGTSMKFIEQRDPLPLMVRLAGAYELHHWLFSAELAGRRNGLFSLHSGAQWRPVDLLSIRCGIRTDTLKENTTLAGLSTGFGIHVMGHELAYAWLPYGELGDTHSVSVVLRFGHEAAKRRNLIQYKSIKAHRSVKKGATVLEDDHQQLMKLIDSENLSREAKAADQERDK
jgi:hypothetical protein